MEAELTERKEREIILRVTFPHSTKELKTNNKKNLPAGKEFLFRCPRGFVITAQTRQSRRIKKPDSTMQSFFFVGTAGTTLLGCKSYHAFVRSVDSRRSGKGGKSSSIDNQSTRVNIAQNIHSSRANITKHKEKFNICRASCTGIIKT